MNCTPTIKQHQALEALNSSRYDVVVFGGAAGGGKIVADDSYVLTPHGFKIGALLDVGDVINGKDGTPQTIVYIHPHIQLEKWVVEFSDGTKIEVAKDHLWSAWRGRKGIKKKGKRIFGEESAQVVETVQMKEWIDRGYNVQIPVCEEQQFAPQSKLKIDPYLLGALLGDGTITDNTIQITCSNEDKEHYKEKWGEEHYSYISNKTVRLIKDFKIQIKKDLEYYNLLNYKSLNKYIPDEYKYSSIEERYELIRGLMDTDGYSPNGKNGCYYYTISPQLAQDVAFVLRSIGCVVTITRGKASYKKNGKEIICNDVYDLYIKSRNKDKLFSMKRKQFNKGEKKISKRIKRIYTDGLISGRCITVSNTDGLYITNDFVVTHNSFVGCMWLILNCLAYPGTKYFIGRETLKELRSTTVPSFFKAAKVMGIPPNLYVYNKQDNFIQFINGSKIDMLNVGFVPSDPMYERFGSYEYTAGWLEEAGEISFDAFDTLKSRIGRHLNDKYNIKAKILITCNPKKNWLYYNYYKPWVEYTGGHEILEEQNTLNYIFIQSLVDDNRFIEKAYKQNLKGITNKIKKERLLKGNWEYDSDPSRIVYYDKILDIFFNHISPSIYRFISADIANVGNDATVIMLWEGLVVKKIKRFEKFDSLMVSNEIRKLMIEYGIDRNNVVVDANGLGVGIKDILKCKGFINNAKAFSPEIYKSLKDQCAFMLADKINNNEILIDDSRYKENIIQELEQLKQDSVDSDKKLKIISKDMMKKALGGKSPDFLDALLMRMYFEFKKSRIPRFSTINVGNESSNSMW